MLTEQAAEFHVSVKKSKSVATTTYPISITILNRSSVGFQKAEVAVKDEGTGTVATAYFGYIAAGASAEEVVQLPGGLEVCIWKIQPDVGDEIYGFGMGNNNRGVRLTITD